MTFRGLTWDHPRGYDALAAAAQRANAARGQPLIEWAKQPLEGFESAPIAALAADYDLIVLDHPHIGEAAAAGCLIPLEDLYSADRIAAWRAESVGPSLRSYLWDGRTWALPLDVATQVMARRPDRLARPPESWDAVAELASRQPVALSLGGPHAFLCLISIAAGLGEAAGGEDLLAEDAGLAALATLHRLAALAPRGADRLNPIALLESMARTDDIALVPLVFGYVTYARAGTGRHRLAFSDTIRTAGGLGGVLGGTGIGFSRRAQPTPDLLDHIAWLLEPAVQSGFIPRHGGQPSARTAWTSASVNADWGGFYADTLRTAETALLRPRFDGFVAFQTAAAERVRAALAGHEDEYATLTALRALWRTARAGAKGRLEEE